MNHLEELKKLKGLKVSLPWKGYGSAVFFELGHLSPLEPRQRHNRGEACISFDGNWRVEKDGKIFFGSSDSNVKIDRRVKSLQDTIISSIEIVGEVPELLVQLSAGYRLTSMSTQAGDPEWSIKFSSGAWLYPQNGVFVFGDGSSELSDEEAEVFSIAESAANRWGIPKTDLSKGTCSDCRYFVPLDGNASLLDYGVCTCAKSALDGQAININSGCQYFNE